MLRLVNVKVSVKNNINRELLRQICEKKTGRKILTAELSRLSIDARDKENIVYNMNIDFSAENEKNLLKRNNISAVKNFEYIIEKKQSKKRPVVVGFGPAGMMAGLYLAETGLNPLILERGRSADRRKSDVEKFFKTGILDTVSNVQFGEGGAGTFSDGKLNTGVNDIRTGYILKRFVDFGAPKEILYEAKPHIGTDKLIAMVKNIRKRIESLGGEIFFETKLTGIDASKGMVRGALCGEKYFETDSIILAVGHSARDTFELLYNMGLAMERKPFAVGVRIEHPREFINKSRYGRFSEFLPAADYKFAVHTDEGRGVYSFCMCPGGYVVAAASEEGGVVTNGMSNFARNGENSNAAILVGIEPRDFEGQDVFAGVRLQKKLEKKAFNLGGGGYVAPVQNAADFMAGKTSVSFKGTEPSYRPGVTPTDLSELFPDFMCRALRQGLSGFEKYINGFAYGDGIMTAVESRSSSPVRLLRDRESLECIGLEGLYPCGEGAGYAGGIMSAAVDGLKCAEKAAGRF